MSGPIARLPALVPFVVPRTPEDALVDLFTVWRSVAEMTEAAARSGTYVPSMTGSDPRVARLADIYDAEMKRIGLSKRAWRG
jgi:hypothetical protein